MELEVWKTEYRKQISEIMEYSQIAYKKNLVSAAGGNISARCGRYVAVTASNVSLRRVEEQDLVLMSINGQSADLQNGKRASKETPFHLHIYRLRPEINYVMHLHPCYSILWSMENQDLPLFTESAKLKLSQIPVIPDEKPGSPELAEAVYRTVKQAPETIRAFFLKNHGILVLGTEMEECLNLAELLEDTAKIAVLHSILTK